MNRSGGNGWAMHRDDWMRWVGVGAGFLGIGLGVMLVGLVSGTRDLVVLGGALAAVQAAFLAALVAIRRFSGLR